MVATTSTCLQCGNSNISALKSILPQHIDNNIINIQLPYNPNAPTEPKLWNGNFYPILLHESLEHLASDFKNIKDLLNFITKYVSNKQIDPNRSNDIQDFKSMDKAI